MFLNSQLDHKYLKSALSLTFPHPICLSYPLGQQLQEKPQIQRTDMSTNHVLIYFEEVRFCDSARSGEIPGGSNTPVQILDNVLHTHTGEGGENSHRGKWSLDWSTRLNLLYLTIHRIISSVLLVSAFECITQVSKCSILSIGFGTDG